MRCGSECGTELPSECHPLHEPSSVSHSTAQLHCTHFDPTNSDNRCRPSASAMSAEDGTSSSTNAGPAVSPSGRTSAALDYLSSHGHSYTILEYEYVQHGGAAASTAALHLKPNHVLKTLIFDDRTTNTPLIVIQHGDSSVDVKRLAAALGVKKGSVSLCGVEKANEWSGYLVGGTSPFGVASDRCECTWSAV